MVANYTSKNRGEMGGEAAGEDGMRPSSAGPQSVEFGSTTLLREAERIEDTPQHSVDFLIVLKFHLLVLLGIATRACQV